LQNTDTNDGEQEGGEEDDAVRFYITEVTTKFLFIFYYLSVNGAGTPRGHDNTAFTIRL
jgi:hypothetical protein